MTRPFTPSKVPPEALLHAVRDALPEVATNWHALDGGRTNRVWQAGAIVVKLFTPDAESPLFPNDPQAESLALIALANTGLAPRLRASGRLSGGDWLAYDYLPGQIFAGDPADVARTLGRLHRLSPPPGLRLAPDWTDHAVAIAEACAGALPTHPPRVPARKIACFLHGDAVPGNIIGAGRAPMLIDWQCPAQGDPAEDLAAYLSPAMQWLYRGKPLTADECHRFLAAYPDPDTVAHYRAAAALLHWRIAAHCLWKAERGADDYRTALHLELSAL